MSTFERPVWETKMEITHEVEIGKWLIKVTVLTRDADQNFVALQSCFMVKFLSPSMRQMIENTLDHWEPLEHEQMLEEFPFLKNNL